MGGVMDLKLYKDLTDKGPIKNKPRNKPLPKAGEKYLEAFERFKEILDRMEIKYEEYFHFKSTKHWRFDFHLIEYRMLIEIAGGPWSGGRKGKLKNKAWSIIATIMLKKWVIDIIVLNVLILIWVVQLPGLEI